MASRFYCINIPAFSEYLYNFMKKTPAERKYDLEPEELRHFRNDESIYRFCHNESLDKRLLMLTRIGGSFCVVVAKEDAEIEPILDEVPEQYQSAKKRLEIVRQMGEKQVFVISSREELAIAHMAAQNSLTQAYTLNYEFVRLQEKLSHYRTRPFNEEVKDALKGMDDLSKIVLQAMSPEKTIQSLTGCTEFEMKIMVAMYPHRNTMITNDRISELIGETHRSTGVAKSCGELEKKNMLIRENPGKKKKVRSQVYMLSEQGINKTLQYLKYIAKNALK